MNDTEYGPQMIVAEASLQPPKGLLLIDFLSRHEAFDGLRLGITRASALYSHFRDELYDVLDDGNEKRLAEVEKIPKEIIPRLIAAWQTVSQEANVVRWLSGWQCPRGLAKKLLDYYRGSALDKLHENPYRMLAFVSFQKCDEMASRLGLAPDDPRRLTAVVQHCLYRELDHGHTVTPVAMLVTEVARFFQPASRDLAHRAIETACRAKAIVMDGGLASTTGIRMLEVDAMEQFKQLVADGALPRQQEFRAGENDAITDAILDFEAENGFPLNESQKDGARMAASEAISVLCGGAGVGKTTLLRVLSKALPGNVHFMALTGQAAKRMTQATGVSATTIETFLRKIAPTISPDQEPLLVIDEASMLDLPLTTRLMRSRTPRSRLLLVGDPAQLPPVNFGLIFHKLAESTRIPRTELTVINRQTEASGIPEISRQIRSGQIPKLGEYAGPQVGVSFRAAPRKDLIQALVDLKADMPDAQILCIKNAGGTGVDDVNEVFHRVHALNKQRHSGIAMVEGDPVIFKKNVAELELVNGSLGFVVAFGPEDAPLQVRCNFSGIEKTIESGYLDHLKLAYAITIHSSQGSQFERVIVVLERSQILDRTLVYTALTRGIQQVVLVGDHQAFCQAVQSAPKASNRRVLFQI